MSAGKCFVFSLLIIALAGASGLPSMVHADQEFPDPDPAYEPPIYDAQEIGLLDAVRMTLEYEPTIRVKAEDVATQLGVVQQAAGQFDLSLIGSVSYELIQRELTAAERLTQQEKREDLREEIADHDQDAADADELIQQMQDARDIFAGGGDPRDVSLLDPYIQAQLDVLLASYYAATPAQQAAMSQDIIDWLDSRLLEKQIERDSSLVAAAAGRENLRRLGGIAEEERTQSATISLQLYKQFRSGITLTPFFDISGQTMDWVGKPKDQDYGGPGSVDTYSGSIGFSVQIPLGRGRGEESAGAFERAAEIDLDATQSALTHAASTSVFSTIRSYWELVAAQETLAVQSKSLELQKELGELVEALIEGDEIPRAELARTKAREAEVEARVRDSYRAVHTARIGLASTIGFQVELAGQAPLASDPFPDAPSQGDLARVKIAPLSQYAFDHRYDLRAAEQLEGSGQVLWKAAVIDLAPIADIDLKVSYAGFDEGGSVFDGIEGTLFGGLTGPSAEVGFNYQKPFGNNTQVGLMDQQAAQYRQKLITSRDLSRRIRANLVQAHASLNEALAQLASYLEAEKYYQESFDNELEKLRYGRSTVIDTITTEQRLVDASLALIGTRKTVAELIAQLRFESATLVVEDADGKSMVSADLTALPLVGGVAGAQ